MKNNVVNVDLLMCFESIKFFISLCILIYNTDRLNRSFICFNLEIEFILCFGHFGSE